MSTFHCFYTYINLSKQYVVNIFERFTCCETSLTSCGFNSWEPQYKGRHEEPTLRILAIRHLTTTYILHFGFYSLLVLISTIRRNIIFVLLKTCLEFFVFICILGCGLRYWCSRQNTGYPIDCTNTVCESSNWPAIPNLQVQQSRGRHRYCEERDNVYNTSDDTTPP